MKHLESVLATLFGLVFLFLSFAVAVETTMRKVFNQSLQGVDELGGYCLAVGAALAFTLALLSRAHIRIDLVHERLGRIPRAALNLLSMIFLALTALGLVAMGWNSLQDSISMNSTAQTPWATPIKYPQYVWVAVLAIFALATTGYALRATWLAVTGRIDDLDHEFQPKGTKDELKEELDDIKARGALDAAGVIESSGSKT
ncbi:MAG: TRAP transporter small permease [Betaproteobacteria bacterium]